VLYCHLRTEGHSWRINVFRPLLTSTYFGTDPLSCLFNALQVTCLSRDLHALGENSVFWANSVSVCINHSWGLIEKLSSKYSSVVHWLDKRWNATRRSSLFTLNICFPKCASNKLVIFRSAEMKVKQKGHLHVLICTGSPFKNRTNGHFLILAFLPFNSLGRQLYIPRHTIWWEHHFHRISSQHKYQKAQVYTFIGEHSP